MSSFWPADMKILALETSGFGGSACVTSEGVTLAEQGIPPSMRSAKGLAPTIAQTLELACCSIADIQAVAVTQGPGSFTGLRVGVTTAKVIAYARKIELIGVDTLAAIARQVPARDSRYWVVMDALRSQLYTGLFHQDAGGAVSQLSPTELVDIDPWLQQRHQDPVAGPGVRCVRDLLPSDAILGVEEDWQPRASSVAQLAWQLHLAGKHVEPFAFAPDYYRPSYAEEPKALPPS